MADIQAEKALKVAVRNITLLRAIKNKKKIGFVLLSLLLGFLSCKSPGLIFCLFLTLFLLLGAFYNTEDRNRSFVLTLIIVSISLRVFALFFVQYYCFKKGITDILGDGASNLEHGYTVKGYIKGEAILQKKIHEELGLYNVHGKTFFNGIFFATFGKDMVSLKFINILCIMQLSWLIYDLTQRIWSPISGKIAMAIVLFWPTLFLWSLTDLKESHFFLAFISTLWFLDKLIGSQNNKKRVINLIFLGGVAGYAMTLRAKVMPVIIPITLLLTAGYHQFLKARSKSYKSVIRLFLLSFLPVVVLFVRYRDNLIQMVTACYDKITGSYIGFLSSGGWNYDVIGDVNQNFHTFAFFIKYLAGSVFHFLLEPLPWHMYSLSMLIAYPLILIWYLLLFFSLIGVISIYSAGRGKQIFPLMAMTSLYIIFTAMSVANIGTAVRFRDAITPIIIMLAACGVTNHRQTIKSGK